MMRLNIRKTALSVCFFFIVYVIVPSYALADEPPNDNQSIITLQKDDCAPFTGTLFSTSAAAQLLVDLETTQKHCDLQKEKALSLLGAQLQLKIDLKQSALEALQYKHDNTLVIKNDQIKFLQEQIRPPAWYESGEFWFAMGLISGILITVSAGYALGQAAK